MSFEKNFGIPRPTTTLTGTKAALDPCPTGWRLPTAQELADLIDAAWVGSYVEGNTGSSDYTTVAWVEGVGKGLTFTPTNGDTGKTLFIPNAGYCNPSGTRGFHGSAGYLFSADQRDTTTAWALYFLSFYPSGYIDWVSKLGAYSLRCVRS